MKTIALFASGFLFLAFCVGAQTFVTNKLGRAEASRLASGLPLRMSEWEMYGFLRTNGLVGATVGNTFSGTAFFFRMTVISILRKVAPEKETTASR